MENFDTEPREWGLSLENYHKMDKFMDFVNISKLSYRIFSSMKVGSHSFNEFSHSLSFSAGCTNNLMQRLMGADKVEQ